jgi:septum formation protein
MRALIQRVSRASVEVEGAICGNIDRGLLVLAGVAKGDREADAEWLGKKIAHLRVFPDGEKKMNRSLVEIRGAVLLISQFTLHGDALKRRRPSFEKAARPETAVPLLDALQRVIESEGVPVQTGRFGAMMNVELVNEGPVTLMIDSQERVAEDDSSREAATSERGCDASSAETEPAVRFHARWAIAGTDSPLRQEPLILASESERRRDLLREIGIPFEIVPSDADEANGLPDDPTRFVEILAERKARAVASQRKSGLVLGADTIVVREGRIYGKPTDRKDAIRMLEELCGREHLVYTGVCVLDAAGGPARLRTVVTRVRLHELTKDEIQRYVDSGEPMGKAGAYAIQGCGRLLVSGIEGDYSNVVGLPLGATLDLIAEAAEHSAGKNA